MGRLARPKNHALTCDIIANNFGYTDEQLAKYLNHHCTDHGCERGDKVHCYGNRHHLGLCDICANNYRILNGCDKCERHGPGKINMLQRKLLAETNIDPEVEWRLYVENVKAEPFWANQYPDLEFNEETWMDDLKAHILARRRKYHNGSASQERKMQKELERKTRRDAQALNNQFQESKKLKAPNPIRLAAILKREQEDLLKN